MVAESLCNYCNSVVRSVNANFYGYCSRCKWVKTHLSTTFSHCSSCFNNTGTTKKGKVLCAAMMIETKDGRWQNRYNQTTITKYFNMGAQKLVEPVKPTPMTPQFECDCYEGLGIFKSREDVIKNDPLYFYSKRRHF